MSQENLDLARRAYETFNRGDIPAWLEQFDPGVVWHTSVDNPDVDTYQGREGLAQLAATWREMFEQLRVEPYDLFEAGGYLLLPARVRGRGSSSGTEIDMPRTWTFKPRNGRIVEVWEHRTREQALEAVGLSE
jgi:ketosteroid isomerase-like protein